MRQYAGEKGAVKAAYFGYKVALIEKQNAYGGAGVNTGTLPSKTLKETALYLSGRYDKGLYGVDRNIEEEATCQQFMYRKNFIIQTESDEVHNNLKRHNVDIYHGEASFEDEHHVKVKGPREQTIKGQYILIATGSYPFHPDNIPFDYKRIHDSDSILDINRFPKSICVFGAGVIGFEYATIFSTMGKKVFLLNRSNNILSFIDRQITKALLAHMENDGIELIFNTSLKSITTAKSDGDMIKVELTTGETLNIDMFLFAAGRNGCIENLNLDTIGIKASNRQLIAVNENYQTPIPHIYAVGDVIGFPSLTSTGMDQARVAVGHMFKTQDISQIARILPFGIYTVPEISTAGISEEEAKAQDKDYCIGIAYHKDMPRGKILGAKEGMLKLIFSCDDMVIHGVHIIGNLATELIHHGVDLIEAKKTLLDVIGIVYNFPTLHDLYKYAAYDGLSNMAGHKIK